MQRSNPNLPEALSPLKSQHRWVNWRLEKRKGKLTKVPYKPNGMAASTSDQATWSAFEDVIRFNGQDFSGIGFCLKNCEIAAFDIDNCRDPKTGRIHPWATRLIEKADSYVEITPSGRGLRIIGYGKGEQLHRKRPVVDGVSCELYRKATRYITVTGVLFYDKPLVDIDAVIDATMLELGIKAGVDDDEEEKESGQESGLSNFLASLLHIKGSGAYPTRSELLFAFITAALRTGVNKTEIIKACIDAAYVGCGIFEHVRENGGAAYVQRQIEHAREKVTENKVEQQLTELGNARRLVKRYGENLKYVHEWKSWMIWQDGHWRRDENGAIVRFAKANVDDMLREAVGINDEAKRNIMLKHAIQSEIEVVLSANKWDADPLLLGVQNGVVDLRTGAFREARQEDYITKLAGTSYDPNAQCPNWEAFLLRIFKEDKDFITYVQRACGYMMTGLTAEEIMFVIWGTGSNGKSTFRETVFSVLGDYAIGSDASLLVTKLNKGGSATPDVARLFRRRLVTINETEESDHLNESRVKFITSQDTITARNLYEGLFDFKPTHKTMLTTNHKPIVRGTDDGIWRRIDLWSFTAKIPEHEKNKFFRQQKLEPELPGILNWLLEGSKAYLRDGLKPAGSVRDATFEYRKDMDLVGRWIEERCELDDKSETTSFELYEDYKNWAEDEIGFRLTNIAFGRNLSDRGFATAKVQKQRGFRGLRLVGSNYYRKF